MRIVSCLILTFVLASFLYAAETVWFEGTFDEMKAEARKQGKLIVIDFSSDT
jgi:hypothetical protein